MIICMKPLSEICKQVGDDRCCVECMQKSQCPSACYHFTLKEEVVENCEFAIRGSSED